MSRARPPERFLPRDEADVAVVDGSVAVQWHPAGIVEVVHLRAGGPCQFPSFFFTHHPQGVVACPYCGSPLRAHDPRPAPEAVR